jgi:ABC-type bacteriocin/lantibiotic exporter with double-glycine peptidase domain
MSFICIIPASGKSKRIKNITLNDELSETDLIKSKKSIENSKIDEFVNLLPKGLKSTVEENAKNFSRERKQRVTLARPFFNSLKIIILDEATSVLVPNTKSKIINILHLLKNEYTTIIISHKQNSLAKRNKVYNLSNKKLTDVQ